MPSRINVRRLLLFLIGGRTRAGVLAKAERLDTVADRGQGTTFVPINVLCNSKPFRSHRRDPFRLLFGQVVQLRAVLVQVIKLALSQLGRDELPRALAQRAIGSEVEV